MKNPHYDEIIDFLKEVKLKKKMSKIEKFAQELAYFMCNPADGIEIGGVSSQLIDIIRTQTKGNDRLRGKVYEWLEFYIEDGSTRISEYKDDIQLAFDDYDKFFYD